MLLRMTKRFWKRHRRGSGSYQLQVQRDAGRAAGELLGTISYSCGELLGPTRKLLRTAGSCYSGYGELMEAASSSHWGLLTLKAESHWHSKLLTLGNCTLSSCNFYPNWTNNQNFGWKVTTKFYYPHSFYVTTSRKKRDKQFQFWVSHAVSSHTMARSGTFRSGAGY